MREKEPSSFNYQGLLWRIVGGARRKAETIPTFRDGHNGCIRITLMPLSQNADSWTGEVNNYTYSEERTLVDFCEREFVFNINPRGGRIVYWKDPGDGHTEPVNCYAYSALKTAYTVWEHVLHRGMARGDVSSAEYAARLRQEQEFLVEANGWSLHQGAVAATVQLNGNDFLQIVVCVSGADSRDDHACALEGMLEAQEFFLHHAYAHSFEVTMLPRIDGMKSPLEQTWEQPEAEDA